MKLANPSKPNMDVKKQVSLKAALNKKSEDADDFQTFRVQPKTKVTVNVSGNRRGMHNAENPPSSEQMRKARAMRKLWNPQMPKLHCSNCQFSAQCPKYRAGYECAFLPFMDSHTIESEDDLVFYMKEILAMGVSRIQQIVIMERLSGARPSLEVSEAIAYQFNQLLQLHTSMQKANQVSISVETEDKSVISRLFGDLGALMDSTREAKEKPIEGTRPFFNEDTKILDVSAPMLPEKTGNADPELLRELVALRDTSDKKQQPVKVVPHNAPIQEELEHEPAK
jgi:hypothetical protein